jgi:hypothetical protein
MIISQIRCQLSCDFRILLNISQKELYLPHSSITREMFGARLVVCGTNLRDCHYQIAARSNMYFLLQEAICIRTAKTQPVRDFKAEHMHNHSLSREAGKVVIQILAYE